MTTLVSWRSRRTANRILIALTALLAVVLGLQGPIPQWADYHAFADTRSWLGIPNAANVLSNLPFALVGLWGLRAFAAPGPATPARAAWIGLSVALICTAAGSAYYHWAPGNGPLVFDRIPIAWACVAIVAAFLADRGLPRWATPGALAIGALAAAAVVLHWYWSEQQDAGDLRLYLFVQMLPMLLVPVALLIGMRPTERGAAVDSAWWAVLACYLAAKVAESLDAQLLQALGVLSGHALKHLLAALGAALLLRGAIAARRHGV
jgi:hypothetical protein